MADPTYSVNTAAIAYASGKSMIDIANGAAATDVASAYVFMFFNNGVVSVTGALTTLQVERHSTGAPTGGSTLNPVKHNNGSANPEAAFTAGTGRTCVASDVFRRVVWSNDEPAVSGASMDEWELLVPNAAIWSILGETRLEPLVCRAGVGEGLQIRHSGSSAVGTADAEIIFTLT